MRLKMKIKLLTIFILVMIATPCFAESARYFAEIKDNKVIRVIVADNKEWCEQRLGGEWVETFMDKKNYAGKGYTYNKERDNFIPPKPYDSWVLDKQDKWKAPVEMPKDGKLYNWNEAKTEWVEYEPIIESFETK
jgi:hypothetical protein